MPKTLTADEVARLNAEAIRIGYNRALSDEMIRWLDDDGISVVFFAMPHEHIAGKRVPLHMRVGLLLKLKDHEKAVQGFMDMSIEDYDKLPGNSI